MIFTIAAKELRALFATPLAWIVLAVLQLVLAWVFLMRLDTFLELQPNLGQLANAPGATELVIAPLHSVAAVVVLMATPLLSMRMIAEERRNQTMTLLVSAPISMTQIALGKYLGLTAFLLLIVPLLLLMSLSLYAGGGLDFGLLAANALGLTLLIATFAAVGLFASSLTSQPLIASIITLALLVGSWLIGLADTDQARPLQLASITRRFEGFSRGLVDTADLAWYILVIGLFLALTIRRLDRDRLRG